MDTYFLEAQLFRLNYIMDSKMLSLDSLQSYLNPVIIVKLLGIKNCSLLCCMASFMSGQEEPNPMLRLVTQAGKMANVTSSGLPAVSRKNNFHESHDI